MFKLSFITLALLIAINVLSQSPHGDKLSIKCNVCHTTDNWIKIKTDSFNHDKTSFQLIGQHKTVACRQCHTSLDFSKAKTECSACHSDIHQQTVGNDCERCHNNSSWLVKNITQIHQQSRFPLIGMHAQLDCYQCHKSASLLRFDPMQTDCFDCHSKDYFATTNPSHVASNFPKDCSLCHNSNNWLSNTFNHSTTAFPLTGSHIGVACASCHTNGYAAIPTTCISCHLANYNATTNPNHTAAKFSMDCQNCHNTSVWQPATFNHNTNTTFPLTGAHIGVACVSCHTNGYTTIPTTCVSCHLANYNATTNPNHATAKFSTDCQSCHTTSAWIPSTFNHNTNTSFPLTGAHIGAACVSCHTNGYNAIPTTCVSCHLANYNATTNPNHTAAQFSTDCQTCHKTTAWSPSTFNHTSYFPITSGNHNVSCTTCHTNPANYTVFTCLTASCHTKAHNQNQGSAGCYSCHPTGKSGG